MAVKQLESYSREESEAAGKAPLAYPDGQIRKRIVTVQTCCRCGRTFDFDERRLRCSKCHGVLRSRVVVLGTY
jgi:NAD-dependent SIR2 family protein deacetylase